MKKGSSAKEIIAELKAKANPESVEGMAQYGIVSKGVLGICMPTLRKMARTLGKNHELAQELWDTDIFDARLLAVFIDDPEEVTERQMDRWAADLDSWAICDGVCMHLFRDTPYAMSKAFEWSARDEEFVKRAGFAMMATLTVSDKESDDEVFLKFLPIIEKHSKDDRVYVRKAVNWALRQIGKRNVHLNKKAIASARRIARMNSKSARWIASDALRELESEKVQSRLKAKKKS